MERLGFTEQDYELYKDCFEGDLSKKQVVAKDDVYQKHDKTFKEILKESKEMAEFLQKFVGLEVNKEELEVYNCNFITKDYHRKESDIVYKQKNVYYIVEHQSKVDKKIPRRILEYCIELMREIKTNNQDINNPLIIPIVIYTGDNKWNVTTDFSETQSANENNKMYSIKCKYKLIDINKYSIKYLKEIECKISKMLILEKCKNNVELGNALKDFASKSKNKEDRIWISNLVAYIFVQSLEEDQTKEILKILYEKEQSSDMDDLIERIKRNEKIKEEKIFNKGMNKGISQGISQGKNIGKSEGILIGKKQSILETIKNMLKLNMAEDIIKQVTGATIEQIEEIKQKIY